MISVKGRAVLFQTAHAIGSDDDKLFILPVVNVHII